MSGFRTHPLDAPLDAMVKALEDADKQLGKMSAGIGDFDSVALSPQEDEMIFQHPMLRFTGQVHPQTGLPYTNAQAAQQLLQDVGPDEYVKYVTDVVSRMDRRATPSLIQSDSQSPPGVTAPGGQDTEGVSLDAQESLPPQQFG